MANTILMVLLGLLSLLVLVFAVAAYLLPTGRGWETAPAGVLLLPVALAGVAYAGFRIYRNTQAGR